MIGDDELAVLVRALTFQLIDPTTGAVAGELTDGSDPAAFPLSLLYDGLEMYHRDAATSDSSLRWTYGDAGNEYLQLAGPGSPAAGVNRPRVFLRRTAVSPSTYAAISSGRPDGVVSGDTPLLELGRDNGLTARFAHLSSGGNSVFLNEAAFGGLQISSAYRILLTGANAHSLNLESNGNIIATTPAPGKIYVRSYGGTVEMDVSGLSINGNIGFYPANPTISAASYIVMPGGLFVSGGTLYSAGRIQARGGISNDSPGIVAVFRDQGAAHTYQDQQMMFRDDGNIGNQQAGISFWVVNSGVAPILRCFGGFGVDQIDCVNSANTAHAPLRASAFVVVSSQKVKEQITELADEQLLATVAGVRGQRFRNRVRPVTIRPTDRFRTTAARWAQTGHKPLTLKVEHTEFHDHDCDVDGCAGTSANPCPATTNDTFRFGLIAEHLHQVAPEATNLDERGEPDGYAVDQIAALAFAAAGAVARQLESLTAQLVAAGVLISPQPAATAATKNPEQT